jgi:hypothetical protein
MVILMEYLVKMSNKFDNLDIGVGIIYQHQYEFERYYSVGVITKRTVNKNDLYKGYYNYSIVAPNGITNVVNGVSIYGTIDPELIKDYRDQEYLKDYLNSHDIV